MYKLNDDLGIAEIGEEFSFTSCSGNRHVIFNALTLGGTFYCIEIF